MLGRKGLRTIVHLALMAWLFVQIGISMSKLAKRSLGTAEGSDHEDAVLYPSVTICLSFANGVPEHEDLDTVYESQLDAFETRFLKLEHGSLSKDRVYVDVSLGQNFTDLVNKGIVSETLFRTKQLVRCLTYNPPLRTKPGFIGALNFHLNLTGVQHVAAFLHNKAMFYPTFTEAAGSTYIMLTVPEATTSTEKKHTLRYYSYDVKRTKWTLANVAEEPCEEEPKDMMSCINHYIEDALKCNLPWAKERQGPGNSGRETCNHTKVVDKMTNMFSTGAQQLQKETGCLGGCEFFEFAAKKIFVDDAPLESGESMMRIQLTINSGAFQAKEQYVIYDFSSFISDVGGYLGLLLGHSLLTLFDTIADLVATSKAFYARGQQEKK